MAVAIVTLAQVVNDNIRRATELQQASRFVDAKALLEPLLPLNKQHAGLLALIGKLECQLLNVDAGIRYYLQSLSVEAGQPDVLYQLAAALHWAGRIPDALAAYEKALILQPDLEFAKGGYLHMKMLLCQWDGMTDQVADLEAALLDRQRVGTPFIVQSLLDSLPAQLLCNQVFAESRFPDRKAALAPYPRHSRLRIGYFSADFGNHPVSHLLTQLVEDHDRRGFEIFGFALHNHTDRWQQRISRAFDHYFPVQHLDDSEITALARSLEIDIAVDLNGYTQGNRTGVFSRRAAPLQASYLGFLGSMGANYYDYLFADQTIIPDANRPFYTEKIVCLPSYQCNTRVLTIAPRQSNYGLPADAFVFCCFNNSYKLSPGVFDLWLTLLQRIQGSVLWLYVGNPIARQNLQRVAEQAGIARSRLVFAHHVPYEEHLARLSAADLFLDTWPYNAGATASDALRMGLPVVTRSGASFASRIGASLLAAVDLAELCTTTPETYLATATRFAEDEGYRVKIRQRLRNNLATSDLFNTSKFARSIEAAYRCMYELQQNGRAPSHIVIKPG